MDPKLQEAIMRDNLITTQLGYGYMPLVREGLGKPLLFGGDELIEANIKRYIEEIKKLQERQ